MFNNCNPKTNGEHLFYNMIKDNINVIFDIGCRNDSEFTDFTGTVHYFDPVKHFIDDLSKQKNSNKQSYFNNFGLSFENKELYYYPKYQSFYDRTVSCKHSDDGNKIVLNVKKAKDYIEENSIDTIDFIKIDTEGYELHVLKGFEEHLKKVNIIQFEYGGTFLDNNTKLIEVIDHLKNDFHHFSYITPSGPVAITDFSDHYQYCNIVCVNKQSTYQPF